MAWLCGCESQKWEIELMLLLAIVRHRAIACLTAGRSAGRGAPRERAAAAATAFDSKKGRNMTMRKLLHLQRSRAVATENDAGRGPA